VYKDRRIDPVSLADTADMLCKHCYQCVQNCPNRLISKSVNPEYEMMGDGYWTPAIISDLYYQAETGKIPVSGAGYAGPFSGPGFDAIWTDMSEIVRPTRDGIHGREYISTSVDIGSKPPFLTFNEDGSLSDGRVRYLDIPLPIILTAPGQRRISPDLDRGLAEAARALGTFYLLPAEAAQSGALADANHLMPLFDEDSFNPAMELNGRFRIIEISCHAGLEDAFKEFARINPETIVVVRLIPSDGFLDRLESLVAAGVGALHIVADEHGRGEAADGESSTFIADAVRQAHLRLVELSLRDEVTLLASGGIALAEHVAKAIICGADAVVADTALWVALECRVCPDCLSLDSCPVGIESAPLEWTKQRLINLIGAWHNQLLEVMGAMGMREIRRLRGEVGRAMFFDQLEKESFAPIFGKRKSNS